MKDIYFKDYDKKDNTAEIPITKRERELLERQKQKNYEQIIRSQERIQRQKAQNRAEEYYDSPRNQFYPKDSEYSNDYYHNNARRNPNTPEPSKKQKKKKGCGCGTFLVCILLIVALLCGGSVGYLYVLCGKVDYVESERTHMAQTDGYSNILLIGADAESGGRSRSDTMILVTLDSVHKKIKFTSFMRDMWVDIPDHGSAKINAAYAYNGADLLIDTLQTNFDIPIDNYLFVDFNMFEDLIDGIGGISVEITENEAEFINRTTHAEVTSGTNKLNGDYALIYCRIRKLDSDFMRTKRQRKVMTAIAQKMMSQNPILTFSAMTKVLPLIKTDMNRVTMMKYIFSAPSLLDFGNDEMRIPADGMYESRYIQGQDAIVPDIESNKEALHKFIYES